MNHKGDQFQINLKVGTGLDRLRQAQIGLDRLRQAQDRICSRTSRILDRFQINSRSILDQVGSWNRLRQAQTGFSTSNFQLPTSNFSTSNFWLEIAIPAGDTGYVEDMQRICRSIWSIQSMQEYYRIYPIYLFFKISNIPTFRLRYSIQIRLSIRYHKR